VDKFADKISKLGGKICMAKTAVPQMGYFAVCQDPDGNPFGLWRAIRGQPEEIICPNLGSSFVVVSKPIKNQQINSQPKKYEYTKSKWIHVVVPKQRMV